MTEQASDTRAVTEAQLVRSSAVVGVGTALSRVTGLIRTVVMAYVLGRFALADAYNLANTTPNIVYDLLLGGILSATLVPVFVDRFEHDDEDGVNAVVTVVTSVLIALTVTAIIAAPWIFRAYTWAAPGNNAADLERAGVPLLRLFLPQVLFYGLTALGTAILNARRRFAAPAFVPVLNNVLVCALLLYFAHLAGRGASVESVVDNTAWLWLLGAGTTAGIVLMTVALLPSLRASGWRFRWRFKPRDSSVRKVAALSGWTLGYVVVNQIALLVVLALAAKEGGGVPTFYLYAFQFFQLPYGLFAVSLMTTITPELASAASEGNMVSYRERLSYGIRLMTLVVLPSSVGMIVIARPLIAALLGQSFLPTADVLANFALGLLGFSLYLFVLRGFYALHDTRTPFFLNVIENGVNVVLAFALIGPFGVQGLAFSYAAAYTIAAVLAFAALRRRVGRLEGRRLASTTAKIAIAAAVMGVVTYVVTRAIGSPESGGAVVRLAIGVLVGVLVYGAGLLVLRVDEVSALRSRLLRR
ncbi:MAG TPA: murein biosynthesis integral membrane protein MurJ [Acidimicrobiales bacterium]